MSLLLQSASDTPTIAMCATATSPSRTLLPRYKGEEILPCVIVLLRPNTFSTLLQPAFLLRRPSTLRITKHEHATTTNVELVCTITNITTIIYDWRAFEACSLAQLLDLPGLSLACVRWRSVW